MVNSGKAVHIEFIKDLLRKGKKRNEILSTFVKRWQGMSERSIDRRIKEATKAFELELKDIEAETTKSTAKEVEARKMKILSVLDRQEILTKIANGELEVEQVIVTKDGIKKIKVKPSHNDIKSSIAELNKMDGSYAATKQETIVTDNRPAAKVKLPDGTEIEV
jgi:pyruvate-formate lyase-activating enzyme